MSALAVRLGPQIFHSLWILKSLCYRDSFKLSYILKSWKCIVIRFCHCIEYQNFTKFPCVEILWKRCGNSAFSQNFHTRKLGEISVFCTICAFKNDPSITRIHSSISTFKVTDENARLRHVLVLPNKNWNLILTSNWTFSNLIKN